VARTRYHQYAPLSQVVGTVQPSKVALAVDVELHILDTH